MKETDRTLLVSLIAEYDNYLSWVEEKNSNMLNPTVEGGSFAYEHPSKESFARHLYREWVEVPNFPEDYPSYKKEESNGQ